MAAKESQLSRLHEMLAMMFIQDIEACTGGGEDGEYIPMSASDKAVIVKFLKDNNITAVKDAEDMKELENEFGRLEDELAKRRKSKQGANLSADGDALQALM